MISEYCIDCYQFEDGWCKGYRGMGKPPCDMYEDENEEEE